MKYLIWETYESLKFPEIHLEEFLLIHLFLGSLCKNAETLSKSPYRVPTEDKFMDADLEIIQIQRNDFIDFLLL